MVRVVAPAHVPRATQCPWPTYTSLPRDATRGGHMGSLDNTPHANIRDASPRSPALLPLPPASPDPPWHALRCRLISGARPSTLKDSGSTSCTTGGLRGLVSGRLMLTPSHICPLRCGLQSVALYARMKPSCTVHSAPQIHDPQQLLAEANAYCCAASSHVCTFTP